MGLLPKTIFSLWDTQDYYADALVGLFWDQSKAEEERQKLIEKDFAIWLLRRGYNKEEKQDYRKYFEDSYEIREHEVE